MFQQQCNASICKCLEVNLNIQRINFLNKIKIVSSSMYTEQKYKHAPIIYFQIIDQSGNISTKELIM